MSDTYVLCREHARSRAAELTDALAAAGLDPSIIALADGERPTAAITKSIRTARCVVLCWSAQLAIDDASDPFADLAAISEESENFVHVRLDAGAGPTSLVYDYIRRPPGRLRRWWASLFDSLYTRDIIAAVRNRRANIYPPEPIARVRMVRRQIMLVVISLGGVGATVSGVLGLGQFIPWPRWQEERAWAAVPDGDCAAIATFAREWPDGRYGATARATLSRPELREHFVNGVRNYPFSGPLISGTGAGSQEEAARIATDWGQRTAGEQCQAHTRTLGVELVDWTMKGATPICNASGETWFCQVDAEAQCRTREPEQRDFCSKDH